MQANLPKLLTEFVGTFFLCLAIALNGNAGLMNLVAIGGLLMGMIYAGGHISMAHYNPAVTLAFFLRKKITLSLSIGYILVQLAAATLAAAISYGVFATSGDGTGALSKLGVPAAVMAEALGTIALVFVILNVAIAKSTAGNQYYGLAIAMTVIGGGYLLGQYSGAAFNPAVALCQSLLQFYNWSHFWIYLVGAFGGSLLATWVYGLVTPGD